MVNGAKGYVVGIKQRQALAAPGEVVDVTVRYHFTEKPNPDGAVTPLEYIKTFLDRVSECQDNSEWVSLTSETSGAYCLYCNEIMSHSPTLREGMALHVWGCPSHPLGKVMALIDLVAADAGNFDSPEQVMEALKKELEAMNDGFAKVSRDEDERVAIVASLLDAVVVKRNDDLEKQMVDPEDT